MKIISIVIPVYNEKDALPNFFNRLFPVLTNLDKYTFEIIVVNDGSTDETLKLVTNLKKENNNIIILDLSKNFGKEAALTAGLDISKGEAVIPIDCDLYDWLDFLPPLFVSLTAHLKYFGNRL